MWPQLTFIGLSVFGLGMSLAMHGQPRGPHSFGAAVLGTIITYTLLYFGGFFSPLF